MLPQNNNYVIHDPYVRTFFNTIALLRKGQEISSNIQKECFKEARAIELLASSYERPQALHNVESELRELAAYMNLVFLNMDTLTKRFIKSVESDHVAN
jgi:hypothetical protein